MNELNIKTTRITRGSTTKSQQILADVFGKKNYVIDFIADRNSTEKSVIEYIDSLLEGKKEIHTSVKCIYIDKEARVTVVLFQDGTKQIVKCSPNDEFDAEVGVALAIARQLIGKKSKLKELVATAKVTEKKPEPKPAEPKKRERKKKADSVAEPKKRGRKPKNPESNPAPKKRERKPKAEQPNQGE